MDISALKTIKVPFSLFFGENDTLATVTDGRRTKDMLGPDSLYYYEEFPADHLSYMTGKDMTYFTERVMQILNTHSKID